jgi:hypothetical protein
VDGAEAPHFLQPDGKERVERALEAGPHRRVDNFASREGAIPTAYGDRHRRAPIHVEDAAHLFVLALTRHTDALSELAA